VGAVEEDYPVSLRGVYYRVVSAGVVEKTEAGYRLVGRELLKLRREGVVPYSTITDGTRWITKPDSWTSLDQCLEDAAASYRRALWRSQDAVVHVFTEKDAISGVVSPVTEKWDVPLGVLRGYGSESFAYSFGEVVKKSSKNTTYVYQLGDHDPSGLDAWRAFHERVAGFLGEVAHLDPSESFPGDLAEQVTYGFIGDDDLFKKVTFARLAVTEDQIEEWDLPTRPTKQTDTRAKGFSGDSVEVDAIPAATLRQLLEDTITAHIDQDALAAELAVEEEERRTLALVADRWGRT